MGGLTSLGQNPIELNPGESLYRRGYSYYLDITDITITTALHPLMFYSFNITKVGGNWTYAKSGTGHDVFSFKLPSRGVYEWAFLIQASKDAQEGLKGNIMETVNTKGSAESFLNVSLWLIISGLLSLFLGFLVRGVKSVF
ncbi:MAG: hypothetical protein QHH17_06720 [Candidatus Bathyarchaeota archaeon]|nr:hypothetical protein [Candidatus Bathyarchaeota archaeon]